jgi:formamidopyrimidine-DNA glycosylase
MPELPEVEHAARRLRAAAIGRRILDLRAVHPRAARALPGEQAARAVGRVIAAVERRGKHQWVALDDGAWLHVHFRMNGDWWFGDADMPLPAHARVVCALDDGCVVALVDPRALATITWEASDARSTAALGPDATDPAFDAAALRAALRGRRVAIKPALLDQRTVAGIGNIYAAEALWIAGIDPRTPVAALGPTRLRRLVDAIRAALGAALADPGRHQEGDALARLHVYDRAGAPCTRCGRAILRIEQSGRSTYYCARCQRR